MRSLNIGTSINSSSCYTQPITSRKLSPSIRNTLEQTEADTEDTCKPLHQHVTGWPLTCTGHCITRAHHRNAASRAAAAAACGNSMALGTDWAEVGSLLSPSTPRFRAAGAGKAGLLCHRAVPPATESRGEGKRGGRAPRGIVHAGTTLQFRAAPSPPA